MRVSIILPIYNVELYLERCIRSLEDQDLPHDEYELIVVNDGSPDNSRLVVLRLMEEFDNIVFLEQENKGVSAARNRGIDHARGRYILFIDPDDYVEATSLARILTQYESHQAEVVFLGYTFLNLDGTVRTEILNHLQQNQYFIGLEAYRLSRGDGRTDPDRMVAILFDLNFLNSNKLRYLPGVPYLEDGEFIARILCLAGKCRFDGQSFYQRTTRAGSATNSMLFSSDKAINGFILAAQNLVDFKKEQNLSLKQREFLNQPICKFVLLTLVSFSANLNLRKLNKLIRKLKEIGMNKVILKGCNKYYRLDGFLYNISPYMYLIHRVLRTPLTKLLRF